MAFFLRIPEIIDASGFECKCVHFTVHIQKCLSIMVVAENIISLISTGQHVIQTAFIFYSPCPCL